MFKENERDMEKEWKKEIWSGKKERDIEKDRKKEILAS